MGLGDHYDADRRQHSEILRLEDRIDDLEDENARLRVLVRRMATELDSRALNHADPAQETREYVGTVEYRGTWDQYEANAPEINRTLAQTISNMAHQAEIDHFREESDQKGADYGLQEDHPSIEASGREDAPEGPRDAQGGS